MIDPRNPDAALVATFRTHPIKDDIKSAAEGRPIYYDMEVVDVRAPGNRSTAPTFPATAFSHWKTDEMTGEQTKVTYAERFAHQYRQFKENTQQTKVGTPLAHAGFLTESKRAELRALNIHTVEQLAHVDGQELKNLGMDGRTFKNQAEEYIAESKAGAPTAQMQAELEALRLRATQLEEDNELLKSQRSGEGQFKDMSDDQLKEFITINTGLAPTGNLPRKILLRMAMEARPSKVA